MSNDLAALEAQRVITVRLPESLHEKLRTDAHDNRTSINQLCIAKLQSETPVDVSSIPAPVAADVNGNVHLVATNPDEMHVAQSSLAQWFAAKIAVLQSDALQLEESRDIAKENGWTTERVLNRHANLARKRIAFYEKCKQAVEAGYCIVPNFEVDLFAIRTAKRRPEAVQSTSRWMRPQGSEGPPAGAGELVSPIPVPKFSHREDDTNWKGETITDSSGAPRTHAVFQADSFDDEIDFPISVARPEIMTATQRAIAAQVFDEFGVQSGPTRQQRSGPVKGDPIVVGRIIDPRSTKYNRRFVTFLIAWYVNTSDL